MDEENARALAPQLDSALPAVFCLPVAVGYTFGPIVWVENDGRPDVRDLQARLASVGTYFSQFNEFELRRIYGKIEVRWIYAFGKHANAFFLWTRIQAPSFERPFVTLPAFQAELAVSFNLDDPATLALLRSIVASRTILIHFDEVPTWVKQLPPLKTDLRLTRDYGRRGKELIQSSLPLEFRPEVVAKMGAQLEQWLARSSF